jgi:hypothetical protein
MIALRGESAGKINFSLNPMSLVKKDKFSEKSLQCSNISAEDILVLSII